LNIIIIFLEVEVKKFALILFLFTYIFAQDVKYYDETFNPFDQLKKATKIAQKENKNILMVVGGDWCLWCRRLAKLFDENEELKKELKKYIIINIHYSKNVKNEKFLNQYPKIKGYPHIFVLNKKAKLIHSQDTSLLEDGAGYDINKIVDFLQKFSR